MFDDYIIDYLDSSTDLTTGRLGERILPPKSSVPVYVLNTRNRVLLLRSGQKFFVLFSRQFSCFYIVKRKKGPERELKGTTKVND